MVYIEVEAANVTLEWAKGRSKETKWQKLG